MLICLDIPMDSLDSFRSLCTRLGIEIQGEVLNGPAGGNPEFRILLDTRSQLDELGKFYFG